MVTFSPLYIGRLIQHKYANTYVNDLQIGGLKSCFWIVKQGKLAISDLGSLAVGLELPCFVGKQKVELTNGVEFTL